VLAIILLLCWHPAVEIVPNAALICGIGVLWRLYWAAVFRRLARRALGRFYRLLEAEDYEASRRLAQELRAVIKKSPAITRMFQMMEGTQYCLEERHSA
jgi:hypothetical protein